MEIEFTNDTDSLAWDEIYPNVIVYKNPTDSSNQE